jgi:hypothetical protein
MLFKIQTEGSGTNTRHEAERRSQTLFPPYLTNKTTLVAGVERIYTNLITLLI